MTNQQIINHVNNHGYIDLHNYSIKKTSTGFTVEGECLIKRYREISGFKPDYENFTDDVVFTTFYFDEKKLVSFLEKVENKLHFVA